MSVRIVSSPGRKGDAYGSEFFDVLSADMHTKLHERVSFVDAQKLLEREVKLEKLACPTGGCED